MKPLKKFRLSLTKRGREKLELLHSRPYDRVVVIDKNEVNVGKFTYGIENVTLAYHPNCPKLSIGRFCSIAGDVQIFLGAYHRTDWISTYPFMQQHTDFFQMSAVNGFPKSRGPVTIGNDVWIGNGVTIMSGITVGDGAVLAAGSHITKDVAAYEMVGGNPAKHIKLRFTQEVIQKLLEVRWWEFPDEEIQKIKNLLCANPTIESLEELIIIRRNL